MTSARVPPHSVELEQLVLGALMLAPDRYGLICDTIAPNSFYLDSHRLVYEVCQSLADRGVPCDFPSVLDELRTTNKLDKAGGAGYVTSMVSAVPSAAHIESHALVVSQKAQLRRLIQACIEVESSCYSGENADEIISSAEVLMTRTLLGHSHGWTPLLDAMQSAWREMSDAHTHFKETGEAYTPGLPTGYIDIDRKLDGFKPYSLNIIAARPSVGKSSLALNIAVNVARVGNPVILFSHEMGAKELAHRVLAGVAKVDSKKIKRGTVSGYDLLTLADTYRKNESLPIFIQDSGNATPRSIAATVRKAKVAYPDLSLVIIDYLQLLSANKATENRVQDVSAITRSLKQLAQEVGVPVIAVSQLSREMEKQKRPPVLSDLRDSGSIEQDADTVLFLWKKQDDAPANVTRPDCEDVFWYLAKNREGETGRGLLKFFGMYYLFVNAGYDNQPDSGVVKSDG